MHTDLPEIVAYSFLLNTWRYRPSVNTAYQLVTSRRMGPDTWPEQLSVFCCYLCIQTVVVPQAVARTRYVITYTVLVILILIKRTVVHAATSGALFLLDCASAFIPRPVLNVFAVRPLPDTLVCLLGETLRSLLALSCRHW